MVYLGVCFTLEERLTFEETGKECPATRGPQSHLDACMTANQSDLMVTEETEQTSATYSGP